MSQASKGGYTYVRVFQETRTARQVYYARYGALRPRSMRHAISADPEFIVRGIPNHVVAITCLFAKRHQQ